MTENIQLGQQVDVGHFLEKRLESAERNNSALSRALVASEARRKFLIEGLIFIASGNLTHDEMRKVAMRAIKSQG